jgi:hypothetical protein
MNNFLSHGSQLNFSINDFFAWAFNDLVSNTVRGVLAEFIVAKALDVKATNRVEWDAYDLEYKGLKIEVKSSAYIQTWNKDKYASPQFGIGKKKGWYADTNTVGELKRHADAYIFCLLANKDWGTIDPTDMDQWKFFIVSTEDLDNKLPDQKYIGLNSLINTFSLTSLEYDDIKRQMDRLLKSP